MTKLRARLSQSDLDRQVQGYVAAAERSIRMALGACHRARTAGAVPLGRVHRVQKDLGAVLGAMGRVGRVAPTWDRGDPDLMPEDERVRQWRAALEERRRAVEEEEEALLEPEPMGAQPEPEPAPEPDGSGGDS